MKPPSGFGKDVNNYLNHYVSIADAKAAGVLTADFTLCGYLVTNIPSMFWPLIFHWVALVLLLFSGFMALYTLLPKTPRIGSSLIFWEDVRAHTTMDTYLRELSQADEEEVERQYGAQNYLVSGVLTRKYACVRWAMTALMLAIPFIVVKLIWR